MRQDRREFLLQKWEDNRHKFIAVDSDGVFSIMVSQSDYTFTFTQKMNDLIKEIKETITTFTKTLAPYRLEQVYSGIHLYVIDNSSLVILMKIKKERFPLVVGRRYNNIHALKRLLSNLSGKYDYYFKFKNTIVLADPLTGI